MAVFNVNKLAREWFENTSYGRNQDIDDDDIVVRGTIRVPTAPVQLWKTSQKNDENTFQKTVKIVNHKPSALAQIMTPASDNVTRVLLEKGIVRGLQGYTQVALPLGENDIDSIFGDRIEIDTSLPAQEYRKCEERPKTGPVLSERYILYGATSAVIRYKKMESKWNFVCSNATLAGNVNISTGGYDYQYDIVEVIKELKRTDYNNDLDELQVVNNQLRFTISGEIQFEWHCQHTVKWFK